MDLIQLKMPPDKVGKMADALDAYIQQWPSYPESDDLKIITVWLRYRLNRWNANHPADPAA